MKKFSKSSFFHLPGPIFGSFPRIYFHNCNWQKCYDFSQANLVVQEARLAVASAELAKAQAQLDEKQAELDKAQAEYDGAMKKKQVGSSLTFWQIG